MKKTTLKYINSITVITMIYHSYLILFDFLKKKKVSHFYEKSHIEVY